LMGRGLSRPRLPFLLSALPSHHDAPLFPVPDRSPFLPTQLLPCFPRGGAARVHSRGSPRSGTPGHRRPTPAHRAAVQVCPRMPNAQCRMPNAECPMPSSSLAFALMGRGLSRPRPLSARTPLRAQTRPFPPTPSHDSKIILSLESQPQTHFPPPARTPLRAHP
jgi:hypothetical protein